MKKIHYNKPIPISDICDNDRFFYIDDIKKTCELFSLSTYGKKTELLENIRNHIKNRDNGVDQDFYKKINVQI
jgi:hypothetical protein